MNNNFQLFVYGSLRSGFKSPAYEYISRYFNFVAEAKVKGTLHDMGDYPAAKPSTDDHYIIGELYSIINADEFSFAIGQLDDYEGLNPEEGEMPLFKRETATVFVDGIATEAWVYWFNGDVSHKPIIQTGDILKYIELKKHSL